MKTPSFGLLLAAAFALGTGLNGLYNGVTNIRAPNQLAMTVAVLNVVMGLSGATAAVLLWRQRPRALIALLVWGATVVGTAMLAPLAYTNEAGWLPAIFRGVVTGGVVAMILTYVRWRLTLTARGESSPAS